MISSDIVIIALAGFFRHHQNRCGCGFRYFPAAHASAGLPRQTGSGRARRSCWLDAIGLRYYWKQWLPRTELTRLFLAALPGLILGLCCCP